MSCAIYLALLRNTDSSEIDRLFADARKSVGQRKICLAVGEAMGEVIYHLTRGEDFITHDGSHFEYFDLYGSMIIPPKTITILCAALKKFLEEGKFPTEMIDNGFVYDPENDDGDGSIQEQAQKLIDILEEAICGGYSVVSFGI